MTPTRARDVIDKARRSAIACPYRVVITRDGYIVEDLDRPRRQRKIAAFVEREHLEAFLTAMLVPPRDHI